ncbi:hypothetical protein, partial [Escherichia coli]|uniref:hypothetical protein n=1 Tax=Escherichia coli TaxID=562 RepID=UPI003EE1E6BC
NAWGDVALEVNQVAAILLVACTEEVVKAHIINGCGRLEGRLTQEQLDNFRQEVHGNGLSSYPHPKLMPEF